MLLDLGRAKIAANMNFVSWEELRSAHSTTQGLKWAIIKEFKILPLDHDLATYICELTNVRQDGNEAVHTADRHDIRSAVQQKSGNERRTLEKLYSFVFEEDINSRDLNE